MYQEALMIAFLVFLALMIAFIVGSICISMHLYMRSRTEYLPDHQLVTLRQETFIRGRPDMQRRDRFDMGMGENARRIVGIGLLIVAVIVVIVIGFFNVSL